jgi:hypothetical protein
MSIGEIGSGRSSIKGAITHYTRAFNAAPQSAVELRTRLRIIIETLERVRDGETSAALYAARQGVKA